MHLGQDMIISTAAHCGCRFTGKLLLCVAAVPAVVTTSIGTLMTAEMQ